MQLYITIDGSDFDDISGQISDEISTWITSVNQSSNTYQAKLIDENNEQLGLHRLGLSLVINKKIALKDPLNFLYSLAKTHKQEFVIGIMEDNGQLEDVCYFGHEEGKPDLFEIANYLAL